MYSPLISVVIPVYNVERYLPLCIDSVLNQDYTNYEVILVDDGSTDRCPEICDVYARNNPHIKVVHQVNTGQGEARNTGLDVVNGEYVFFLDSDDTIHSYTFSAFVNFLNQNGEFSIVGTDFQRVTENNRMASARVIAPNEVFDNIHEAQNKFLKRTLVILTPGSFYNVKWLQNKNLRLKNVPFTEDILFVWEALCKAQRIGFIHTTLYNYLTRPGSIMRATKLNKLVASYPYFKQLQAELSEREDVDPQTRQFMLARWIIGLFHTAAKLCTYAEYAELLKSCEGDLHIKNARKFPDTKVRILSALYIVSHRLYYHVNKLI